MSYSTFYCISCYFITLCRTPYLYFPNSFIVYDFIFLLSGKCINVNGVPILIPVHNLYSPYCSSLVCII